MDASQFIKKTVEDHPVVLFMKGTAQFPQCGFSGRAVQLLKACGVTSMVTVNVLDDDEVRQAIKTFSNWPTIPQLYVGGEFVGGADIVQEMYDSGELQKLFAARHPPPDRDRALLRAGFSDHDAGAPGTDHACIASETAGLTATRPRRTVIAAFCGHANAAFRLSRGRYNRPD